MEKLTIKEKAKRYDEAIKIAKSKIKNDKDHVLYEEDIIEIFHELKKKTDEEMIQKLIAVCHLYYGEGEDAERDACLKWLEKQKIKPYSGVSFLYNNHTWGMCARDGGVDILCDSKLIKHIGEQKPTERKDFILASFGTDIKLENDIIIIPEGCVATIDGNKIHIKREGKSALEAINEEKVDKANKVEPKFKVGDWITDGNITLQIEAIKNDCYLYSGDCYLYSTKTADKVYHLWTINDAKEGDILISWTNKPFIYNGFFNETYVGAYCGLNAFNRIIIADKQDHLHFTWTINKDIRPATKEQRDFLFSKMKESGHEWDAKKKELK